MRFLFSTGTVFPARRGSTSVYVGTWLAKQRVYKHRWHRSPLRGVLLLIEKRCPAPNVTMFLPPSTGRATIIALRIDRSSPRVLLIARWPLRAERILRASHNDSHKIRNSRENCIESLLVNYFNCVDEGKFIYFFLSAGREKGRKVWRNDRHLCPPRFIGRYLLMVIAIGAIAVRRRRENESNV